MDIQTDSVPANQLIIALIAGILCIVITLVKIYTKNDTSDSTAASGGDHKRGNTSGNGNSKKLTLEKSSHKEKSNKSKQAQKLPKVKKVKEISLDKDKDTSNQVKDTWLFTTLKGHTGVINSMDYSTNGKCLATCADVPIRRQNQQKRVATVPATTLPATATKMVAPSIDELLHRYLLTPSQLCTYGYPIESGLHPGQVIIYRHARRHQKIVTYNVKAQMNSSGSSSSSTSSSSGSGSDSDDYTIPKIPCFAQGQTTERKCSRCSRGFFITNNEYLTHETCVYHWGKIQAHGGYTCCGALSSYNTGCTVAESHVWQGLTTGCNGPYSDYVRLPQKPVAKLPAVAVDCEMCFTVEGLELTKVTLVSTDGAIIYDTYVRPENVIVDFNTRFSGITYEDIYGELSCAKSLSDVQLDLAEILTSSTVLIGHGLENDLRALKLIHDACVDTAVVFPHKFPQYRRSLKNLAQNILGLEIQKQSTGHNSCEDAFVAMELMLWCLRKDLEASHAHAHRHYVY